jgi:hypothetical protein
MAMSLICGPPYYLSLRIWSQHISKHVLRWQPCFNHDPPCLGFQHSYCPAAATPLNSGLPILPLPSWLGVGFHLDVKLPKKLLRLRSTCTGGTPALAGAEKHSNVVGLAVKSEKAAHGATAQALVSLRCVRGGGCTLQLQGLRHQGEQGLHRTNMST